MSLLVGMLTVCQSQTTTVYGDYGGFMFLPFLNKTTFYSRSFLFILRKKDKQFEALILR